LRIDKRFDLLYQHARVALRATASTLPIAYWRVLGDALLAGVIDAHNDRRLDTLALDQRIGRLRHMPCHPWNIRGSAVKEVLPVLQIEHWILRVTLLLVIRRQIDDERPLSLENMRAQLLAFETLGC